MIEPAAEPSFRYDRTVREDGQDSLAQICRRIAPGERVLDVGCSTGALGRFLAARKCRMDAIETDTGAAEVARPFYENIWPVDIERAPSDALPRHAYDAIVCADVLEHLVNPGAALDKLKDHLSPNGRFYVSVPNVGYVGVVAGLIAGEFKYRPTGLLDATHLRFFTRATLLEMLRKHGLEPTAISTVRSQPRETEFKEHRMEELPIPVLRTLVSQPDALTYQFIVEARPGIPEQTITPEIIDQPARIEFTGQLFWDDGRGGLDESRSCARGVALGEKNQRVEFAIPPLETPPSVLRFDPVDRPGFIQLHEVQLLSADNVPLWVWNRSLASLGVTNQLVLYPDAAEPTLLATGTDPSIHLSIPGVVLAELKRGGKLSVVMGSGVPVVADVSAIEWVDKVEKRLQQMEARHADSAGLIDQVASRIAPLESGGKVGLELRSLRRDALPRARIMRPTPNQDLRAEPDGSWSVIGTEPAFEMRADNGRPPFAWCHVEVELVSVDRQQWERPSIYADSGKGFSELHRFHLNPSGDGVFRAFVQLPSEVRGLRLSPGAGPGRFTLGAVRFTEVGKLRAGLNLLTPRVRAALTEPSAMPKLLRETAKTWRTGGLEGIKQSLRAKPLLPPEELYASWVREFDTLTEDDRRRIRERLPTLPAQPLISVVMTVRDVPEAWLRHSIESVRRQLYPYWELCVVQYGAAPAHVRNTLDEFTIKDSRIHATREAGGTFAEAANTGVRMARGEHVAFLEAGNELAEPALYLVARELAAHPDTALVYSDEDRVTDGGRRTDGRFKPDWSPEFMWSSDSIGGLAVYRAALLHELGGFRAGFEGAETHDLNLRVSARSGASSIRHIPHVLHHSRTTARLDGDASRRAVAENVRELKLDAEVLPGMAASLTRVKFALPRRPKVSLIIPTRDGLDLLRGCVTSLRKLTGYSNYEIVIVDNQSRDPKALAYLKSLEQSGEARVLRYDKPFNYSAVNNWAVAQTDGEVIGLLNNDIEVIDPAWLTEMVSHALRPDVGAVGAKLLYPDTTVQHAGVIGGMGGVAAHVFRGLPRDAGGYLDRALMLQELSIVTAACLLVRRDAFEKVEGMDVELQVAFNDVDFCLKLRAAGYRNIWTPHALLYHLESATRGADNTPVKQARLAREIDLMRRRWGASLMRDPFYNPNLSLDSDRMEPAFPPRAIKPWRARQER